MESLLTNVTWLPAATVRVFGLAPVDVTVMVSAGIGIGVAVGVGVADGEALDESLPHATIAAPSAAARQNPMAPTREIIP